MTPDDSDPDAPDTRDPDVPDPLDPDALDAALADAFEGSPGERRAVVRQATDLRDAGRYREDAGDADTTGDDALTVDAIVDHLADAPRGSVADRWNWWVAALEVAYGGYREFEVRRYRE